MRGKDMTAIPMYVFTGFLESGKTRFIQQTLEGLFDQSGLIYIDFGV